MSSPWVYMNVEGALIKPENFEAALQAINAINFPEWWKGGSDFTSLTKAAIAFDCETGMSGGFLVIWSHKDEQSFGPLKEEFWKALAPYLEDGAWIQFQGCDSGEKWAYSISQGHLQEYIGEITWVAAKIAQPSSELSDADKSFLASLDPFTGTTDLESLISDESSAQAVINQLAAMSVHAIPTLADIVGNDEDRTSRRYALKAIEAIGQGARTKHLAVPGLMTALKQGLHDEDQFNREVTIGIFVNLGMLHDLQYSLDR